jgi:hypothetical protein
MSLYDELEIDEKSQVGSMFMARVANEIKRAATIEKSKRKLTQQAIADKVGTSRAVINREMSGVENLTARRTAEILWAMGWEPYFEARPIPEGNNEFVQTREAKPNVAAQTVTASTSQPTIDIIGLIAQSRAQAA